MLSKVEAEERPDDHLHPFRFPYIKAAAASPTSAPLPSPGSMDTDAAGFKLFGKVIQPADAHQRAAEESSPMPPQQLPVPPALTPPPLPPPPPLAAGGTGEPLPCPRCGSRETKFCYFNNYNVRQPRHLCRACRRYWTAGGALRRVASASPGRRRPRSSAARSAAVSEYAASSASAAEEGGGER